MSELNVKIEQLSASEVKLTVEVTTEQFDKALDMAFEKVVKNVKIDGFRPGKAPKNVFIRKYGWESLYQDGVEFALQETYYKAARDAKIVPVSDPKIDLDFASLEKGKGFTYTAVVEVWPTPELGEYKGISIKPKSTRVTKKMVDEQVQKELAKKAEIVVKEGAAALGDTVVIDFEGFVDGEAFEGGKSENYPLELGSQSFIPGFEDQLVGTKAGDDVDVNVVFPENYAPALASKAALFKVKVHEVKTKVEAKLDDELVEDLNIEGVKTVDEYLAHVKEQIKKEKEHEAENYFMETLFSKIEKNSNIIIPQAVINEEVAKQVQKIEQQAKQYQVPVEILVQYSGFENLDAYRSAAETYIKRQIMQEVILEEIIKKENFEVSAEELEQEYVKFAGYKAEDSEEEKAKKLETVKAEYPTSQVEHHLKVTKALELIKNSAVTVK